MYISTKNMNLYEICFTCICVYVNICIHFFRVDVIPVCNFMNLFTYTHIRIYIYSFSLFIYIQTCIYVYAYTYILIRISF
jgi:hypothetical protein